MCARHELLLSYLLLLNMLSVNHCILPTVLFSDSTQRNCVNILSFSNVFFLILTHTELELLFLLPPSP